MARFCSMGFRTLFAKTGERQVILHSWEKIQNFCCLSCLKWTKYFTLLGKLIHLLYMLSCTQQISSSALTWSPWTSARRRSWPGVPAGSFGSASGFVQQCPLQTQSEERVAGEKEFILDYQELYCFPHLCLLTPS